MSTRPRPERSGAADLDVRSASLLARRTLAMMLAGGRGSRLRQLTDWRAKPAVPFGGKFRIIDFTLSNCVNSGIRRIGICTQYKAQSLIRHVQRGWSFLDGRFDEFIELLPAQQRVEPTTGTSGTADAVYQNLDILRPHDARVRAGARRRPRLQDGLHAACSPTTSRARRDMTVACVEVPVARGARRSASCSVDDTASRHRLPREAARSAADARPARPRARQHGHLRLRRAFLYEQLLRDAADAARRTTSATTSFRC